MLVPNEFHEGADEEVEPRMGTLPCPISCDLIDGELARSIPGDTQVASIACSTRCMGNQKARDGAPISRPLQLILSLYKRRAIRRDRCTCPRPASILAGLQPIASAIIQLQPAQHNIVSDRCVWMETRLPLGQFSPWQRRDFLGNVQVKCSSYVRL